MDVYQESDYDCFGSSLEAYAAAVLEVLGSNPGRIRRLYDL